MGLPLARIAIEAGTHSPGSRALLAELGHDVLVANPRKVRAIYDNDKNRGRVDAQQRARFARMDPNCGSQPDTGAGDPHRHPSVPLI